MFSFFRKLPTHILLYSCYFSCLEWQEYLCSDEATRKLWLPRALKLTIILKKQSNFLPHFENFHFKLPTVTFGNEFQNMCFQLVRQIFVRRHIATLLRSWHTFFVQHSCPVRTLWSSRTQEWTAENVHDVRLLTLARESSERMETVQRELCDVCMDYENSTLVDEHIRACQVALD